MASLLSSAPIVESDAIRLVPRTPNPEIWSPRRSRLVMSHEWPAARACQRHRANEHGACRSTSRKVAVRGVVGPTRDVLHELLRKITDGPRKWRLWISKPITPSRAGGLKGNRQRRL